MELSEKEIVGNRNGKVLSQNTILKIDMIPKVSGIRETTGNNLYQFSGTKNFRKVNHVHALSQPPLYTIRATLNFLNKVPVQWGNS